MKRLYITLVIPLLIFFMAGCSPTNVIVIPQPGTPRPPLKGITSQAYRGLVYTHTITPLDLNMKETPKGTKQGMSDVKHFSFYYLNFIWDSNAIYDIARKNGIKTVYYADLETLKILSFWTQYTVHIYGE
ncbi:MAG: TRL-like family protein [Proteobacteria bacterium]|nr:TRL-like family protein [Pseudomonadota bacterium]